MRVDAFMRRRKRVVATEYGAMDETVGPRFPRLLATWHSIASAGAAE